MPEPFVSRYLFDPASLWCCCVKRGGLNNERVCGAGGGRQAGSDLENQLGLSCCGVALCQGGKLGGERGKKPAH